MIELFMNGQSLTDKVELLDNINVNNQLSTGNFFIQTNDMSNMPTNYRNTWVWLFVRKSSSSKRVIQELIPDSTDSGWIAIRSVGLDQNNKPVYYAAWNVIDFKHGKVLMEDKSPL